MLNYWPGSALLKLTSLLTKMICKRMRSSKIVQLQVLNDCMANGQLSS